MRQANPIIAQLKQHNEEITKRFRALSCIHSAVSNSIFTRIMACENTKDVWDKLQEELHGSHRNREMQALNLLRELKVLKMKDNESIKEYSDKVMKVVNQLRLLWENLHEKRSMNKVLVSLPKEFKAKTS